MTIKYGEELSFYNRRVRLKVIMKNHAKFILELIYRLSVKAKSKEVEEGVGNVVAPGSFIVITSL